MKSERDTWRGCWDGKVRRSLLYNAAWGSVHTLRKPRATPATANPPRGMLSSAGETPSVFIPAASLSGLCTPTSMCYNVSTCYNASLSGLCTLIQCVTMCPNPAHEQCRRNTQCVRPSRFPLWPVHAAGTGQCVTLCPNPAQVRRSDQPGKRKLAGVRVGHRHVPSEGHAVSRRPLPAAARAEEGVWDAHTQP